MQSAESSDYYNISYSFYQRPLTAAVEVRLNRILCCNNLNRAITYDHGGRLNDRERSRTDRCEVTRDLSSKSFVGYKINKEMNFLPR